MQRNKIIIRENSPSVEIAFKIASVFDVPLDYLIGEGKHAAYDKHTIKRLEDIEALDQSTRTALFNIIDTFLRDAKQGKHMLEKAASLETAFPV